MTASRHAARPGDARSATLFLGEALPKYIRWAFLYPRPNIYMAGRTLPYPYLSASADLLPRESRGVLVHPNGVCLHNDPQSRVKTAQAKGVGGHGATLTKYLLQVESPGGPIGARLLLTENLLWLIFITDVESLLRDTSWVYDTDNFRL